MPTLQDQLMKSGLVDAKKAKKIGKDKRKKEKQSKHDGSVTEQEQIKQAAEKALKAKVEEDRKRAAELNKIEEAKQIAAQIKQLIHSNSISRDKADISYQFVDDKKVKKILVTALLQKQIIGGVIAIAAIDDGYSLVPAKIAAKIAERDAACIKVMNEPGKKEEVVEEDDPYADYPIPDDLMW